MVSNASALRVKVVDINALQQMTPEVRAAKAFLFAPRIAMQWGEQPINGGSNGQKLFAPGSPPYGADIFYRNATSGGQVRQDGGSQSVVARSALISRASRKRPRSWPMSPRIHPR